MDVVVIGLGVIAFALFVYLMVVRGDLAMTRVKLADEQDYTARLEKQIDAEHLVARQVLPYIAQTSVAAFYNEANGVQANFTQRQEVMRRTMAQNEATLAFLRTFNLSPAVHAVASHQPLTYDVVELGPDAKTPTSGYPWKS